jgi:Putative lumazine-binding
MSVEAAWENRIGRAPDRDEILRVVRLYTDGFGARNPALFREAFHPSARISYITPDGQLHEGLIADGIDGWANWSIHVTGRILAVVQAGDVATVVLGFDADTGCADCWVDIHSLLRVDGTWKIMNKTATHASRADWAAPST